MEEDPTKKYQVEIDDNEQLVFSPELGNVVFCSAVDSWAFAIPQFAALFSKKLGMNRKALEKALWGDYYYNPTAKRVFTKVPLLIILCNSLL
jgi:ribosome assembly protein 1